MIPFIIKINGIIFVVGQTYVKDINVFDFKLMFYLDYFRFCLLSRFRLI
ncbi:hypothetical protein EMIT036CA2_10393 [Chryseobacterium sp. IT-36CA2]